MMEVVWGERAIHSFFFFIIMKISLYIHTDLTQVIIFYNSVEMKKEENEHCKKHVLWLIALPRAGPSKYNDSMKSYCVFLMNF